MSFLLDTCAISEMARPHPHPGLRAWMEGHAAELIQASVITVAELHFGVQRLPHGSRRNQLQAWLDHAFRVYFEGGILPISETIARRWGVIVAARNAEGRPISTMDAFLAATCAVHDLALVTRNVADFEGSVERIVNPWI
ncbi:MAG TPA: type II toxin-antitoxin system VapC family toxin [Terriglobales bacterium]